MHPVTDNRRQINLNDHVDRRLDRAISSLFPRLPKSAVYRFLRKGGIKLNRKQAIPSYIIKKDDILYIFANVTQPVAVHTEALVPEHQFKILLEDSNLLIMNKDTNIAVHKGTGTTYGVIESLGQMRDHPVHTVHRLDKHASGCLVIAKNPKTALHFQDLLSKNKVVKEYTVVVEGRIKSSKRISFSLDGQKCVTFIARSYYLKNFSILTVQTESGRKHQIRRHLEMLGHPVVGDTKYGSRYKNLRLFLHASSIEFTIGSKHYRGEAPLSQQWLDFIKKISISSIAQ
jgi:RluA family pseudouridine synthase